MLWCHLFATRGWIQYIKYHFMVTGIIKIKWPHDCSILAMGIPIPLIRQRLYIEPPPGSLCILGVQKRSVRVISGSNYNAHTDPLLKKLRLVKLADLFTLNVLKMYYKFKHARLPSYVENMFENFSRHHEHETRQSLILEEPMVNTASGENCLRYILPRIVNNTNPIIINMVDSYSFEGFVRYLKNYMIVHYVDYCVIPNCYICNHMSP